jgi:hypothetical protein
VGFALPGTIAAEAVPLRQLKKEFFGVFLGIKGTRAKNKWRHTKKAIKKPEI